MSISLCFIQMEKMISVTRERTLNMDKKPSIHVWTDCLPKRTSLLSKWKPHVNFPCFLNYLSQVPGCWNHCDMEDTWGRFKTFDGSFDLLEPSWPERLDWYCCMLLVLWSNSTIHTCVSYGNYAMQHGPLAEMQCCRALKQDCLPLPKVVWYQIY